MSEPDPATRENAPAPDAETLEQQAWSIASEGTTANELARREMFRLVLERLVEAKSRRLAGVADDRWAIIERLTKQHNEWKAQAERLAGEVAQKISQAMVTGNEPAIVFRSLDEALAEVSRMMQVNDGHFHRAEQLAGEVAQLQQDVATRMAEVEHWVTRYNELEQWRIATRKRAEAADGEVARLRDQLKARA
jgi:hypothetical protein